MKKCPQIGRLLAFNVEQILDDWLNTLWSMLCADLQSTMAPLLTLAQVFRLSIPTVSTRILLNCTERPSEVDRNRERKSDIFTVDPVYKKKENNITII